VKSAFRMFGDMILLVERCVRLVSLRPTQSTPPSAQSRYFQTQAIALCLSASSSAK